MQLDAFTAKQFDSGQADRVRTPGRSGCKHPMRPIVGGGRTDQFRPTQLGPTRFGPGQFVSMSVQFELRGAIELPDDDEVREALDVGEPRLKLRQNLEHSIGFVFSAKPLGNFACVLVRTTHKSNWVRGEHLVVSQKTSTGLTKGATFPILGAFRTYVQESSKSGEAHWRGGFEKVLQVWEEVGPNLVEETFQLTREGVRNPDAIGKNRKHRASLYMRLQVRLLQERLQEQQDRVPTRRRR